MPALVGMIFVTAAAAADWRAAADEEGERGVMTAAGTAADILMAPCCFRGCSCFLAFPFLLSRSSKNVAAVAWVEASEAAGEATATG